MELFEDAREYDRIKTEARKRGVRGPDFDNHLEAIIPFARKEKPVVIRVGSATEILDAIDFARELDIKAILRDSGTESWKVADKLAEADIPILIGSITRSVSSSYDPYDTVYSLPARLHEAGVLFAFYSNSATMARDMPLSAGLAVGFGLPEDAAIAALTSNTARIYGIDEHVGTLEVGKRADIIVTDRSPLQATSNVIHMFIGGKTDRHQRQLAHRVIRKVSNAIGKIETSKSCICERSGPTVLESVFCCWLVVRILRIWLLAPQPLVASSACAPRRPSVRRLPFALVVLFWNQGDYIND